MNIIDIIEKKKTNQVLSEDEINYWINGFCKGEIADYQCSALLMAIAINGMNDEETFYLTKAMTYSGETLDFSSIDGIKVDKHSTGGVGDKTSMTLMPLLASVGLKVAKMSGGALGFCGGTVDKLSSIPSMNVFMNTEELIKQVKDIGIAMVGQTGNLCPADKLIYALRDVTATVGCMPLIVSSIMSKKLACGDDVIVLDVKYGNGSFMPTIEEATELAKKMISVGKQYGKNIGACLTSMDQPLGLAVGNALEVKEAIDTLHGKGPKDFTDLVLDSGAVVMEKSGLCSRDEAKLKLQENIDNGLAASIFKSMINAQGGNGDVVDNTSILPQAKHITEVKSLKEGYVSKLEAKPIGELSMSIGAGRIKADDKIDYAVGIVLNKKIGDYVKVGDVLGYIHHNRDLTKAEIDKFINAYDFSINRVKVKNIIEKVL